MSAVFYYVGILYLFNLALIFQILFQKVAVQNNANNEYSY